MVADAMAQRERDKIIADVDSAAMDLDANVHVPDHSTTN
jgi:hypothetical protein